MSMADVEELERRAELVSDVETATKRLSEEDRKAYADAQRSVVEARQNAETKEGLLQLH